MTPTGFDATGITVVHFVIIALFALLTIVGIWWGVKMKRRRRHAEEAVEEHRVAADAPIKPSTDAPPPEQASMHETLPGTASIKPAARAGDHADAPQAPMAPGYFEPVDTNPAAAEGEAIAAMPLPDPQQPLAGDITRLKGLGPKLAATLAGLGITRVDQIAAMSPAELDALDAQLGAFRGRPARDRWAEQARLLNAGDRAGYEAAFGKLGA